VLSTTMGYACMCLLHLLRATL